VVLPVVFSFAIGVPDNGAMLDRVRIVVIRGR
jgi:hypothetical protein